MFTNTQQYLANVEKTPWMQDFAQRDPAERVSSFKIMKILHENHLAITIAKITAIVLGVAALATLPLTLPVLGAGAIAIAAAVGSIGLISLIAHFVISKYISPHNMMFHAFKEGEYKENGKVIGKLSYEGHAPILTLNMDNPRLAGKAHGYLCGPNLHAVREGFEKANRADGAEQAHEIPRVLAKIREYIPQEYIDEMQGVVDGYNQWASEQRFRQPAAITLDELLLLHLTPDHYHFNDYHTHEKAIKTGVELPPEDAAVPLGRNPFCTAIVAGDRQHGPTIARNMDWPSHNVVGKHTLIINRKYNQKSGKQDSAEVTTPGLVGTGTGMNASGLSLAINVCNASDVRTRKIAGIPAFFFNRLCLDTCKTVEEAAKLMEDVPVLGTYHLTVADKKAARAFQMFTKVQREWQEDKPLIVTNRRYDKELHMFNSGEREEVISQLFREASRTIQAGQVDKGMLARHSLTLPFVNNMITTHTVVMEPGKLQMAFACDNAYAASQKLQVIPARRLFSAAPAA